MNKKLLFWLIGIGAVILLIGIVIAVVASMQKDIVTPPDSGVLFPGSGSATSTSSTSLSIPDQDGDPIQTKDFINNGETTPDVVNPGTQVLAGSLGYCLADGSCPSGASTTDFSITYDEADHSFNVVLLKEPLGEVRRKAEEFLLSRLGVTQPQLCALKSYVGVPYFVNENFNGNLGFSFCTGSTKLP